MRALRFQGVGCRMFKTQSFMIKGLGFVYRLLFLKKWVCSWTPNKEHKTTPARNQAQTQIPELHVFSTFRS